MFLGQIELSRLTKSSKTVLDRRAVLGTLFCLLAIVHSVSLWRSSQPIESALVVLIFYGFAFYFYCQNPKRLKFSNHGLPQLLGGLMACLMALKIVLISQNEVKVAWALMAPLMVLSLVLLADGFRGVKSYWRVLFGITWISAISPGTEELLSKYTFLNTFSAQFSSFILWYFGFSSRVESSLIYVNGGVVDVYAGCTALPFLILFLNFLIVLWLFCPSLIQGLSFYLLASLAISFPLSVIRIAVMALVVNDKPTFAYWHGTSGSNLFMIIALSCFWGVIFWKDSGNVMDIQEAQAPKDWPDSKPQLSGMFTIFSAILILIFIYALLSPEGGANKIGAYQFPTSLNLSNWNVVNSEPLTPAEVNISTAAMELRKKQDSPLTSEQLLAIREAQKGSNIVMDGRRYFYKNETGKLALTLRYIVNTLGLINAYYEDSLPDVKTSQAFQQAEHQKSPTKETLKFSNANTAFLVSCITPLGKALIDQDDFTDQRNNNIKNILLNPSKLADWLMGKSVFFDHRCLWVELAVSPKSAARYQLEPVWQELKIYLTKNFPSL